MADSIVSAPGRSGLVRFGDARLSVWEEPGRVEPVWEKSFKHDVFSRIVQQMNRLGWVCIVPPEMVAQYSESFARNFRYCQKGDLQADLRISGRCIELEMWQDVANREHPKSGKYDYRKEARMPYLLKLEMERTRRRIRDYLCNVFDGYVFESIKQPRGPFGLTARAWIEQEVSRCWHYRPELGRRGGEGHGYNNKSADGCPVTHGARVWTVDYKGRVITGEAFYNINNMWWVITGRYDCRNVASFEIYTKCPDDLRTKRNARLRQQRLEGEMASAVKMMEFERAAVLRDILYAFPGIADHG